MRDDNTYTGDGKDLDLVTLETERQKDRETVTENSEGNQQQQRSPQGRTEGHRTENQLAAEQTEPLSEQIQLG